MPIPTPNPGEKESDFIGRCMSDLKSEFADNKQRLAVCYDSWRKTKKLAEFAEEFECECIECGHKMKSAVHCKNIKCPECGGQMRRVERPGPGQSLKSYDIDDKELIAVGTWNTQQGPLKVTEEIIDAIMESYNDLVKTGTRGIPIKLGHDENQKLLQKDGYPSAGWVKNLRKKTKDGILKIVGDLKTIPSKVYKIIQNKGFVNVSPELSKDFKYLNTGKKYKWLFNRLALLGIDQPAQDLDELVKAYAQEGSENNEIVFKLAEPVVDGELNGTLTKEEAKMNEDLEKANARVEELEAKTKELQEKSKEQEDEKAKLQKSLDEAEEKVTATEEEKRKSEVTALIDGYIDEKGGCKILPAQKESYMQILLAMPEDKTYKFSDNGEEKEGNALELFKSIMNSMPNLVEFSEFSEQKEEITKKGVESDGTPIENVELAAKLGKIVKEEKVSTEEAYDLMVERGEL